MSRESDEDLPVQAPNRKRRVEIDSSDGEIQEKKRPRKANVRTRWSDQEYSALKSTFKLLMQERGYPTPQQVETVKSKNPCLNDRSLAQIKSKLPYWYGK